MNPLAVRRCPFCRGVAVLMVLPGDRFVNVVCKGVCKTEGPLKPLKQSAEAVAAWNRIGAVIEAANELVNDHGAELLVWERGRALCDEVGALELARRKAAEKEE